MNTDFLITDISRIVYVGEEEYTEPKTVFENTSSVNQLIFHFSGVATVHFNEWTLKTRPNTIRFLPQGKITKYEVVREKSGACIDICFTTDKPVSAEAFTMAISADKKLGALFKKAFAVWVAKGDGYYFECISLIYKIFAEMQKENYIPEKQYLQIKPVIDYINEHFLDKKITTEDLLKNSQISYSYLKRLFIKKFGISPTKYIITLKINYSCDLLQSGKYTVSQVAEICGYSDIYFFSRQFKEYLGISPTEFMNKYKSSK